MTHDVRNLAIIDGSVFVTVGAANPTSTISALALRAVEHLLAHRADVPVPEPARSFAFPAGSAVPGTADVDPDRARHHRDRRAALASARVADALPRPGDERMPAADDVGVAAELLDAVLDAPPRPARRPAAGPRP